MYTGRRIGFIDIGSNSIRLAIYELTPQNAHRVVGEFKESARLSQRIGTDGILAEEDIQAVVNILRQFKLICEAHRTTNIRVVATAAVRNASNSREIIRKLHQETGLPVELLSGEDEARIGFIGMINTIDIDDGILVDIGGGSTEVSVFRARKLLRSVSFPFGAVNTAKRFTSDGNFSAEALKSIRSMVETALDDEPWIREHPNLPLVGLGGTMRNLGKINQRLRKYPLPLIHNYIMNPAEMDELLSWLSSVPAEKRKKIDGLSKDRYDIIVPGLTILHTLFNAAHASHYVVSGAGLRDGLFYEAVLPHEPGPVPERSARNLLALHPSANPQHSDQVSRIACVLFDALLEHHGLPKRCRTILKTASLLYRIGIVVNYYQFARHSFYMIAHSRLDGFTHRETLLCAMTACYKTKNRTYQQYLQYKDILLESDVELVARLGSLLRLAAALDYSQTQPVADVAAAVNGNELHVHLQTKYAPVLELKEAETLHKDFKRLWGLSLFIRHS